jgi:RNA polymerase sigma-70 factor (ECF subfamily)
MPPALVPSTDPLAFTSLVVQYQQTVYRWALTLADDPDDADDLVQETFILVARKLGSYEASGSFSAWLYSITRRAAGQRRRLVRRRRRLLERGAESAAVYLTDPGARVDRAQAVALIRMCFHDLPRKQREIFDLVDLQGLSPAEAAVLTDTKPATVRAHLFKARASIRSRILSTHPGYAI